MQRLPLLLALTACGCVSGLQGSNAIVQGDSFTDDIGLPGVNPPKQDQYYCTTMPVSKPGFIVDFVPRSSADRVHHMLLFGCRTPAKTQPYWDCLHHANICAGETTILFAWARNAPPLELPKNVGVPVGDSVSGIFHYVLQVHYMDHFKGDVLDYSGIIMHLTRTKPQYFAGVYLLAAPGGMFIPPKADSKPRFSTQKPVYAFAFRTHAHGQGRIISGYKKRNGLWTKIGKSNPLWPQRFYSIETPVKIENGDEIAAQCVYHSEQDHPIYIGNTGGDEMCNFYMYYYTDSIASLKLGGCYSPNYSPVDYPADSQVPMPTNLTLELEGKKLETTFGVKSYDNWVQQGVAFGQIGGLAIDNSGEVLWVFHRSNRVWDGTTFDGRHKFLKELEGPIKEATIVGVNTKTGLITARLGANAFYLPHDIYVDANGDLWLTDVAMHQVFKYSLGNGGVVTMALGTKFAPGNDQTHFCQPAGVVVGPDNNVYIADGYCNSRVAVYSASTGAFVTSWGNSPSTFGLGSLAASLGNFNVAHGLTLDAKRQLAYVADRENGRIQILSLTNGQFVDQIVLPQFGRRLFAVKYCSYSDTLFALNGPSISATKLQVFAINPSRKTLMYSWTPTNGQLSNPHSLAVSDDCQTVYVGEIGPNKLWKFEITGKKTR